MNFFKSIWNFILSLFKALKDNTFLKDGLSIDETKVSAMVIAFLTTTMFALVMYALHGDITINLLNFLNYLIFGITGVNVIDKVVNKIGGEKSSEKNLTEVIPNDPIIPIGSVKTPTDINPLTYKVSKNEK